MEEVCVLPDNSVQNPRATPRRTEGPCRTCVCSREVSSKLFWLSGHTEMGLSLSRHRACGKKPLGVPRESKHHLQAGRRNRPEGPLALRR